MAPPPSPSSMGGILSSSRSPILLRQTDNDDDDDGRDLTAPAAGPRTAAEAAADHDRLKLPQSNRSSSSRILRPSRPKTNLRDWICIRKAAAAPTPAAAAAAPPSCCCGCCPTCCRSKSRTRPELWQPEGQILQPLQQPCRSESPPYSKSRRGSSSSRRVSRAAAAVAAAAGTADNSSSLESLSPHSSYRN